MTPLLLVEDDVYARQPIHQALQKAGYNVYACVNYEEARNYLMPMDIDPLPYVAILSDYNLGQSRERTGLAIYQFANRSLPVRIPFIATSSEMENWQKAQDVLKDPMLHLIPKLNDGNWDASAILAKLQELGIKP